MIYPRRRGAKGSRGWGEEEEVPIRSDCFRIPDQSDILVAYSTSPGYVSFRDTLRGSWFVQVLCRVLTEESEERYNHN